MGFASMKKLKVSPSEFGYKIAKTMDKLKSSHVYFIIQMAYGEIFWEEAQDILTDVIKQYERRKHVLSKSKG